MVIPTYRLENFTNLDYSNIKQGAKAFVFKGNLPSIQSDLAIKKWIVKLHEKAEKRRIKQEVTLLNPHDNIIEFLGILINGQSEWIGYVMPYMEKGSLDEIIHNRNKNYDDIYTNEQITNWINEICCSLSYLHSKKIIHRDIKPSNILLGNSYEVKLSDFGFPKSLEHINETLIEGVPYYHMKYPSIVVLHQMIDEGVRPQLRNNLSKELSSFLKRCWHVDASERPTINEVLEFCENTRFSLSTSPVEQQNENFNTPPPVERTPEKQTILLVGGYDGENSDSLLMLENNGQDWKELNIKLPYAVHSHGAQFLNNHLYIFGGQDTSRNSINFTYKLSRSLQWEKMANMNQTRRDISNSNVVLNNQIWVCGGRNEDSKYLKSVEMYDPETNEWKDMKEMNECRYNAATAVVNGKIFCSGGMFLNSVECYDPSSDVWTLISNMPQKIWEHGAVEIDGHLVVIGGWSGNSRAFLKNVWTFGTKNGNAEWIERRSMSVPRACFSIAKIDNKIFVCGQGDNVEIFDGEIWRNGPKMPAERSHTPAVAIPMEFARSLW